MLRQTVGSVAAPENYLSGLAHPVVFDAALLRPDRMVAAAAAIVPTTSPRSPSLRWSRRTSPRSPGLAELTERLFDTRFAVARIWRAPYWEREMILKAAVPDTATRPFIFMWRLLQGRPDRLSITPIDAQGRRASVRLQWRDALAIGASGARLDTSRVDIAVLASTGGAVGARRIYFDPVLHWSAPWTDAPSATALASSLGSHPSRRHGSDRMRGPELQHRPGPPGPA
jgi:hypothetical protein